jgi:hypothetical protein
MADDKQAFQTHVRVNRVQFWSGDREVMLEKGDTYETSDPAEIRHLQTTEGVKDAVTASETKKGGDS